MEMLKKMNPTADMGKINKCLNDLRCYGTTFTMTLDENGSLMVNNTYVHLFSRDLKCTSLYLNFHFPFQKQISPRAYRDFSRELQAIALKAPIILSSENLTRIELGALRSRVCDINSGSESLNEILVATKDDFGSSTIKGDMIYSLPVGKKEVSKKAKMGFDRLVEYANNGVPVLLDWENNLNRNVSDIVESTSDSDFVLVSTSSLKTIKRVVEESQKKMIYKSENN